MKILCFTDSLGSGGAQRQLVNLAIGFKEKGHEVSFLVYHKQDFFQSDLEKANIPVFVLLEKSYFLRILKIRSFIRKGNFDGVLSFLEGANFIAEIAALPFSKFKLIVGERSANPHILISTKLRIYRWFHLLAYCVVSNSSTNIEIVRKIVPLLPRKKCKVIYNLIDFEFWSVDTEYKPFKNNKLNIIVVASHQFNKNAVGLIEAINRLPSEDKNKVRIDWYGDKSPDNSFEDTITLISKYQMENYFFLHPATDKIKEKMQSSDLVCLPSFYEGLPNVLCEAMALGKPIISSSISDIPLFISNKNCLFNPTDIDQIKDSISYILKLTDKELKEMGILNKNKATILFDKKSVVESYLTVFKSL